MPAECPKSREQGLSGPEFDAVRQLSEQARRVVAGSPNPLSELAMHIRTLIAGQADPYLLMGILLEGAAQTLATRIPAERQSDTALAAILTLRKGLHPRPGA